LKQVPILDLKLEFEYQKDDINTAINRCLEHQRWIMGPELKELEDILSEYLGVKHCIGVSSGTDALALSLRAWAIKLKGKEFFDETDEIITTPFTFTATGDAILRSGATPVYVDIDPQTFNLDPVEVRKYLLSAYSSKVIGMIPVHLYGQGADMDEFMNMAEEFDLFVLEDVAQAIGGKWKDKKLGSIGTAGAFSFFPSKNLGGFGDGGLVSTDCDRTAELVRMLLRHGGKDKYNVDHIGYNSRLDTLQAAIVLAKSKYLDEFNDKRRAIAKQYNEELSGISHLQTPLTLPEAYHVYHQYTVRTSKRDELQAHLKNKGISTMVYYPFPLHKMKVFKGRMKLAGAGLPLSELASREVLSLPVEPLQCPENTGHVIDSVKEFF
jgi:dTDP-4-amino-4,6-dideoxygalactose transaminase